MAKHMELGTTAVTCNKSSLSIDLDNLNSQL